MVINQKRKYDNKYILIFWSILQVFQNIERVECYNVAHFIDLIERSIRIYVEAVHYVLDYKSSKLPPLEEELIYIM